MNLHRTLSNKNQMLKCQESIKDKRSFIKVYLNYIGKFHKDEKISNEILHKYPVEKIIDIPNQDVRSYIKPLVDKRIELNKYYSNENIKLPANTNRIHDSARGESSNVVKYYMTEL